MTAGGRETRLRVPLGDWGAEKLHDPRRRASRQRYVACASFSGPIGLARGSTVLSCPQHLDGHDERSNDDASYRTRLKRVTRMEGTPRSSTT